MLLPVFGWKRRVVAATLVALAGCSDGPSSSPSPARNSAVSTDGEWFVDYARESGLDFVHFNGMSGELYYPEMMAPGVALLDYDNDGDLDVYLVQGQMLGRGNDAVWSLRCSPRNAAPLSDRPVP